MNGGSASEKPALSGSISQYLATIEPPRQAGSTDPELIEQLVLLGVAYQGLDRDEDALATLDEAIALTIDVGGPENLEHIPLQEQKIQSYLSLDDIRRIDDTEELIYALHQKGSLRGSRQMYYATISLADWNSTAYYRENFGGGNQALKRQRAVVIRTPRALADASGDSSNPIFNGTIKNVFEQDIVDSRLRRIDSVYKDYQDAISERASAQLNIMVDIAKRVARLAFVTKQEMEFERDNYVYVPNYAGSREQAARNSPRRMDESYESGKEALEYSINLHRSVSGVRQEALAAALLDLGDWHLSYGKAEAAKDAYLESYETLLDVGYSSGNIDIALATDIPTRIPIFVTHLYTRDSAGLNANAELVFEGYVDVSYTIDGIGNARNVRFLGSSSEDSSSIEKILEVQLRSMKFRPTLRGGELISPGMIETRYYYAN